MKVLKTGAGFKPRRVADQSVLTVAGLRAYETLTGCQQVELLTTWAETACGAVITSMGALVNSNRMTTDEWLVHVPRMPLEESETRHGAKNGMEFPGFRGHQPLWLGCCFELLGTDTSQMLMPSRPIVKAFDVVSYVGGGLLTRVVDALLDALLLQA